MTGHALLTAPGRVFMSEAVSTYRRHADWSRRIANATPDQKDADVLRDRARRLSELADRFEREENERLPSQARPHRS
jgi:hypothetical protein